MANNRVYLGHRGSGYYIHLGKRMGFGWYTTNKKLQTHIEALLVETETVDQDSFVILYEDAPPGEQELDSSWTRLPLGEL